MNIYKKISGKILSVLGICLLAGSLSACGDDTNVIISDVEMPIPEEIMSQLQGDNATGSAPTEGQNETVGDDACGVNSDAMAGSEDSVTDIISSATQSDSAVSMTDKNNEAATEMSKDEEMPSRADADSDDGRISITISAVGDVTLGNYLDQGYSQSLMQTYEELQDDSYFFENVYDIFSQDDMTLVNLEGVLTNATQAREGQIYSIKGKPEYVKALTSGSVEAASMANNHRLDYFEQGSDDTVATLEEEGIVYAYDENVGIYETKGIRIGFVAVNEFSLGYVVEKTLQDGIAKLQEEQVDLIFACCHWGVEREYYPEEYQQALGKKCIDWGADLVIGHHPHVLQGIEEYQGKYIVYSLGNFCFGANKNPPDKDSMIFQQTFTFVDGEKQEDKNIRVIPCSVSSVSQRNDYKPTPAIGEEAQRIIDRLNEFSKDFGVQFDEEGMLVGEQ